MNAADSAPSSAPSSAALIVFAAGGAVCALARMNDKAYRKSLEQRQLWVLERGGRVLPWRSGDQRAPAAIGSVTRHAEWYEARLASKHELAAPGQQATAASAPDRPAPPPAPPTLAALAALIDERKRTLPEGSYTAYLFGEGLPKIRKKLGEEAIELITAATPQEVASEAADLIYHLLVLLAAEEVSLDAVLAALTARA